ncbi:MAG: DNA ligase-associated DEXH box helicase, partial [Verrucomicrobiae bacterium]|nr:DNA ligase-associated DEXH box helicase [Verrucomicrobiae bacterium]
MKRLLEWTPAGLYCSEGDFFIDPQRAVSRAVITHAHTDHARPGSRGYLTTEEGAVLLRARFGKRARIESVRYEQPVMMNGVRVSLHPAGHILGSAQVRVEYRGQVWVVSGDYKCVGDPTCAAFEPVRCDVFVSEYTFGRPHFRWPAVADVVEQIVRWWEEARAAGEVAVLETYPLGKTQRMLALLAERVQPLVVSPQAAVFVGAYRRAGVRLPAVKRRAEPGTLVVGGWPQTEALGRHRRAVVTGWAQQPGRLGRYGEVTGFVMSDHADWDGLVGAIRATGAGRVWLMHGTGRELPAWLARHGWNV